MTRLGRYISPNLALKRASQLLGETILIVSQVEDEDAIVRVVKQLRKVKWQLEKVHQTILIPVRKR